MEKNVKRPLSNLVFLRPPVRPANTISKNETNVSLKKKNTAPKDKVKDLEGSNNTLSDEISEIVHSGHKKFELLTDYKGNHEVTR